MRAALYGCCLDYWHHMQGGGAASLCCRFASVWCRIRPCEWRGHLDVTTVMAAAMICVTADTERCHLSFSPPFTGHPVLGQTVVAKGPRDFPAVNTWSIEDIHIITVGHDVHGDSLIIPRWRRSHPLVGALDPGGNSSSLSQSLLRVLPKLRQDTTRSSLHSTHLRLVECDAGGASLDRFSPEGAHVSVSHWVVTGLINTAGVVSASQLLSLGHLPCSTASRIASGHYSIGRRDKILRASGSISK